MKLVTITVSGPGCSTVGRLIRNALRDQIGLRTDLVDVVEPNEIKASILIDRADELVENNTRVVVEVGMGEARGNA